MRPPCSSFPFCSSLFAVIAVSLFVATNAAAQQPRVVFATSVTGTADLGSWPEAGNAVGAGAGDAICQTLAENAGLANPDNFAAWLSTTTDDAYCRLHGFPGTKAADCGQAQLPVSAGPWVRTDGLPFSESIDRLLLPEQLVYYPIALDEVGNPVTGLVFTATSTNGAAQISPTTCSDWTVSSGDSVRRGDPNYGSAGWTTNGGTRCDSAARLVCFETGAGPPVDPPSADGALAFGTSVVGNGDLSSWSDAGGETGLMAGDAICQAKAQAAGFEDPSSFKAWLSDATTNAADRFTYDGPLVRPDGVKVVDNLSDLASSNLIAPINLDDIGRYRGNSGVWTGTGDDGMLSGNSCDDWTTSSDTTDARAGSAHATDIRWTTSFTFTCDLTFVPLYCLSDLQRIFVDGFESGDASAWSSSTP